MKKDEDIYTIVAKPDQNLVIVRVTGYFNAQTHAYYLNELEQVVKSMAAKNGKINMLFDLMECMVQSREIADNNSWMFKLVPYVNKVATALTSTIYKMQLKRVPFNETVQFFETIEAAQAWLDES